MTVEELERMKPGDRVKVIAGASMYAGGWVGKIDAHQKHGSVTVAFDHGDGYARRPLFASHELEAVKL